METIRGIVSRVLKEDEDKGTSFLAVEYEKDGGLVVAKVGVFARGVRAGDAFVAEGDWKSKTYRGKSEETFEGKQLRPDLPRTRAGAERFLSSIFNDTVHGVSAASVRAFLDASGGVAALRAAVDRPEALLAMSSRQAECRDALLAEWAARTGGSRAVSLLQEVGLEEQVIDRIVGALRERAFGAVRENPYVTAPIPRVGFGNADKVGQHLGVARNDRRRLLAAVEEVLRVQESLGSTAADIPTLLAGLKQVSGIDGPTLARFLEETSRGGSNRIAIHTLQDGFALCASLHLYAAEVEIAHGSVRLLRNGRRNPAAAVRAQAAALFERPEFRRFDAVQRLAVEMAATEPFSILTGGPGTGKSTVMAAVAALSEALDGGPLFLVAPTGKAAKRLAKTTKRKTSTVHRLLKARRDGADGTTFGVNAENPLPARCTVVVDEASMLDAEAMAALISAMPADGRLLLVGDRNQLPSVGPGSVLADLLFAETGGKVIVPSVELVEVYRQAKDSGIATGAALIRDGRVPDIGPEDRAGVSFRDVPPHLIVDRIERLVCDELPARGLDPLRDVAILCPMAPGPGGTWEINRRLSLRLNPGGARLDGVHPGPDDPRDMPVPRMGDRVMLTENDPDSDVMNGEIGTIVGAGRNAAGRATFKVQFDDGPEVEFPASRWRKLILAYAGTVHKSQGSQYKAVIMPVLSSQARMLDRTLLYTGWTRAEETLILMGERSALDTAVATWRGDDRMTLVRRFLSGVRPEALAAPGRIDWKAAYEIAAAKVVAARASARPAPGPASSRPQAARRLGTPFGGAVSTRAPANDPGKDAPDVAPRPQAGRLFSGLGARVVAKAAPAPVATAPTTPDRPRAPVGRIFGGFGQRAAPRSPESPPAAAAPAPVEVASVRDAVAPPVPRPAFGSLFGGLGARRADASAPSAIAAEPMPGEPAVTASTTPRRGIGGPFGGLGRRPVTASNEDSDECVEGARIG